MHLYLPILCLAFGAFAENGAHVVHKGLTSDTGCWKERSRASQDAVWPMEIALVETNLDATANDLLSSSDAASPSC